MTREQIQQDPYATPPAPRSKGGPMLRLAIAGVLLGGAALGYAHIASQPVEPLAPAPVQQEEAGLIEAAAPQQMADAGDATQPEALPQAAPAPAPERAAPAPRPQAAPVEEALPPPSTTIEPAAPIEPTPAPTIEQM
ncbi:MAG: hypothetical protein AB7P07_11935 [Hyphomonadaceae bacterium]